MVLCFMVLRVESFVRTSSPPSIPPEPALTTALLVAIHLQTQSASPRALLPGSCVWTCLPLLPLSILSLFHLNSPSSCPIPPRGLLSTDPRLGEATNSCHDYWWTNLLYINNFIPWKDNLAKGCMAVRIPPTPIDNYHLVVAAVMHTQPLTVASHLRVSPFVPFRRHGIRPTNPQTLTFLQASTPLTIFF